jgi:hypothetical protein
MLDRRAAWASVLLACSVAILCLSSLNSSHSKRSALLSRDNVWVMVPDERAMMMAHRQQILSDGWSDAGDAAGVSDGADDLEVSFGWMFRKWASEC